VTKTWPAASVNVSVNLTAPLAIYTYTASVAEGLTKAVESLDVTLGVVDNCPILTQSSPLPSSVKLSEGDCKQTAVFTHPPQPTLTAVCPQTSHSMGLSSRSTDSLKLLVCLQSLQTHSKCESVPKSTESLKVLAHLDIPQRPVHTGLDMKPRPSKLSTPYTFLTHPLRPVYINDLDQ